MQMYWVQTCSRGDFPASLREMQSQKRIRSQLLPSVEPTKSQTPNKLSCKRPLRSSRPRPRTQVVLLPPDPVWAGRASIPTRSELPVRCVRFASGRPGLPHRRAGTKGLPLRHKSGVSRAFGFHPGSAPRRAGPLHTSAKPCATDARRNCGPHTFSRGSTAVLPATDRKSVV